MGKLAAPNHAHPVHPVILSRNPMRQGGLRGSVEDGKMRPRSMILLERQIVTRKDAEMGA